MIVYREAGEADTAAAFEVFQESLADLLVRTAYATPEELSEVDRQAVWRDKYEGLYTHLARTASRWWVAEESERVLGYSRATSRDGLDELTELFVRPDVQSSGVGAELLARAMPAVEGRRRAILATGDPRAMALYMRAGHYPRMQVLSLSREPEVLPAPEGLEAVAPTLAALGEIDRAVLGHVRHEDHRWLMSERTGHVYLREGAPVGYGYVGSMCGPIAALEPGDMPAILTHCETVAAGLGVETVELDVPGANTAAIAHLLARRCKLDSFIVTLMTDEPFGRLDRYVITSPTFFL